MALLLGREGSKDGGWVKAWRWQGIEDEEIEFMEDLLAMVLLYGGGGLAIGGYGAIEAKRLFG